MNSTFAPSFSPDNYLDRLPPENIDAEEAILGAILLDPKAIFRIDMLKPEHFYVTAHKIIYEAFVKLTEKHKPTDLINVTNYLIEHGEIERVGGRNKLARLLDLTVTSANIDHLASLVIQKAIRRQVIALSNYMIRAAYDEGTELSDILSDIKQKAVYVTDSVWAQNEDDSDKWHYERLLESLRDIHFKIADPGLKQYKLQELAKRIGKSVKDLDHIYIKSLCATVEARKALEGVEAELGTTSRKWLINGIIPAATTMMVYADGGVGKTKFMYDLMYCLTAGENWNKFPVTSSGRKVLLYQGDESKYDMLQALNQRGFTPGAEVRKRLEVRFGWNTDAIPILIQDLEEYEPDLIVIDSLTFANRYSLYDENRTEYSRSVLELNEIAARYDKTIVIIHHASRQGLARGSTSIRNAVSEVLKLEKDPSPGATPQEKILTIEKSRSRRFPCQYRLFFNEEDFSLSVLEEIGQEMGSPDVATKERILNFLQEEINKNTRFEAKEIALQLSTSDGNARRCLNQLARDGLINCDERGPSGAKKLYYISHETQNCSTKTSVEVSKITTNPWITSSNGHNVCVENNRVQNDIVYQKHGSPYDHPMITSSDHLTNPFPTCDTAKGDPYPYKKSEFSDLKTASKMSDPSDHVITFAGNDCPATISSGDRKGDPIGDRVVEKGDRDRLFEECDRLPNSVDVVQKPFECISDHPHKSVHGSSIAFEVGAIFWSVFLQKKVKIVKLFKTIPEADVCVSGEIEIVRVKLADLTLLSSSPSPAGDEIALGDEVVPLVGTHKKKVLVVTTIDSDGGIWLKQTQKGFSPTVGPFQRTQLKKSSGRNDGHR